MPKGKKKVAMATPSVHGDIRSLSINFIDVGTVKFSEGYFEFEEGPYTFTADDMIEAMQEVKRIVELIEVG